MCAEDTVLFNQIRDARVAPDARPDEARVQGSTLALPNPEPCTQNRTLNAEA